MPNKYAEKKGWRVPKQRYKLSNWSEYNEALRQRGNIAIWIDDDVMKNWYEQERIYDGTGAPKLFSDYAITICHELRQVFKLPLRQCQGFIDSIFQLQELFLLCPDYSCLSKRLATLRLYSPRYKKSDTEIENIAAIAIDSTGLKRFGRDEWHQEKHRISANRSWRKLHIAVDDKHIIHATALTDRFVSDDSAVNELLDQVDSAVLQVNADGGYDKNSVYEKLSSKFDGISIVIPPSRNAIYSKNNHTQRNTNLQNIKTFGRMPWQRATGYGQRNYSELAIQRYKRILGNKLHAREMSREIKEATIGAGCLNKMTRLGMPKSYRCA
jgi:Transposase DDE domain